MKAAVARRDTARRDSEPSETEALGQRGSQHAPVPGSREYRKQVEKLLAGKISYAEFMQVLQQQQRLSRSARLGHLLRTLLEGIAGRSFPTKTPPR